VPSKKYWNWRDEGNKNNIKCQSSNDKICPKRKFDLQTIWHSFDIWILTFELSLRWKMFEKLEDVERRYESLYHLLGQPEVINRQDEFQKIAKEYAELGKVVDLYRRLKKLGLEIEESQHLLEHEEDEDMKRLAKEELNRLMDEKEGVEEDLRMALLPKDPNDEKNILLEIRAGTGGEEKGRGGLENVTPSERSKR